MTVEEALRFLVNNSNDLAKESWGDNAKRILAVTKYAEDILREALGLSES